MSPEVRAEILEAYGEALAGAWPRMLALALLPLALWGAHRLLGRRAPPGGRLAAHAVVALVIGLGLWLCLARAACFDDAYISFRYAQNLVDGHGLVFNPGERVEGYTNFLWTLLIALVVAVSGLEAPLVGVLGALASFGANLLVVHRISLRLLPAGAPALPIAVVLLAVQNTFVSYGTTGLETQLASLLSNLGLLWLLREPSARTRAVAGLWLILATLTRPDHALFYAAGAAVVAADAVRELLAERPGSVVDALRRLLTASLPYAAPFALYLGHMAFRVAYYGETMPNTYHAKLAAEPYYEQGWVYALVFHCASHFWLVAVLWLVGALWALRAGHVHGRFGLFAVLAVLTYNVYVARVGGDFMHGRFYLSLMPLYLLGAEQLVHRLSPRSAPAAAVAAGLLLATAQGVRLQAADQVRWHIADENTFYRITRWSPMTVSHYNYRAGKALGRMREAGLSPVVASTSVGMVGYYSGLTVIDKYGLTDHHIARLPTRGRHRPGHERRDSTRYLYDREVDIARRQPPPRRHRELARIWLGPGTGGRHWYLMRYDAALVDAMRAAVPELRVTDFPRHLDRQLDRLERGQHEDADILRRDAAFYERYYFAATDDPERLARMRQLMVPATAH